MSTNIRAELSDKNPYWIDRHRYYELKHFCLQYPLWHQRLSNLGFESGGGDRLMMSGGDRPLGDPTAVKAEQRLFYQERIELVEKTAAQAAGDLAPYILRSVTEEVPYVTLRTMYNIPCCRDTYYSLYRKFFWLLSKARQ